MINRYLQSLSITVGVVILAATMAAAAPSNFIWSTVVNNNDLMPGAPFNRTFNSYNQPSVNVNGLVVMRARSIGGGGQPATHGIYTRDMSVIGPVVRILDRSTEVTQPNNAHYPPTNPLLTRFIETPSFPRIDMGSDTIVTRGNHQPTWIYSLPDGSETRGGTTGIYTNPFGPLITGAGKLGAIADFGFFSVPGLEPPTMFDVFPGAPSVTRRSTIVFKGNYTVDGVGKTGVFFRDLKNKGISSSEGLLKPAAGTQPVVMIANNTDTVIPGTRPPVIFGSTSPPSAAGPHVVFAGFDNEEDPTLGGIYLAPLAHKPQLRTLVSIGERVPGLPAGVTFNRLGEGGAFDGRFVGFWGAWGTETRKVRLYCPTEGNKDRIAYCNRRLYCKDGGLEEDTNSVCDGTGCYQDKEVPVNQGIFVHDVSPGITRAVATTGADFDEFLFWNYSGKTPCVSKGGEGGEGAEDDGEAARWRLSAFVAVAGRIDGTFYAAFKAVRTDFVLGIYLSAGPGQAIQTVVDTMMDGEELDPEAPPGSLVTELGLEREGLRGDWLAISAKMGVEGGSEEEGMAGIYLTRVPAIPRR